MTTQTKRIIYAVGEHETKPDTVIISITGTGIDHQKEKKFMEILCQQIAKFMVAQAEGISTDNID